MSIEAVASKSPELSILPRPVDEVIHLAGLQRPSTRTPNFEAENAALLDLAKALSTAPDSLAQRLVDAARSLTGAESAGLSLVDVEDGKDVFRWIATTGEYARYANGTMPRHFSPCGEVLKRGIPLLMSDMRRAYPYVDGLHLPPANVLLVPFEDGGKLVGTIWVVRHSVDQTFDGEDQRMVQSLAVFASAVSSTVGLVRSLQAKEVKQARVLEARERELKDMRRLQEVAAKVIGAEGGASIFRDILDAAVDIVDAAAGTIQLLDPATQSLTFLASRGFDPKTTEHFSRVDATSGSPCGVALAAGKRVVVTFDPDLPDPDGSIRWHLADGVVCAQSMPLVSRSGKPLGMFSTHWSTQRELTERDLRFLDLLGRQAADLIERNQVFEALQASEHELREADRRKDEFIAMLAHELRNPLAPIRTGIDLLKAIEGPVVQRVRPIMERQVVHMVRLVDDLLDVSRITSGKVQLKRETVSVNSLINTAVEAHHGTIEAAGLRLVIDRDDSTRHVNVDPARLSQVISNLLHNAAKFTPAGGQISIRTELESEAGSSGQPMQVIQISDTGLGIPEEMLGSIFELFTQVRPSDSARQGGLGIGLALSRSLVELHGGTISAESLGADKGSRFTIRIPGAIGDADAAAVKKDAPHDHLAGLAVLVVDDNQDAADTMAMMLAQYGCDARVAHSASESFEVLRSFTPSLVLLDIGMPDIDGFQACRQIRADHGNSFFIAALTGWGQDSDRKLAAQAGFDLHLTKPVDLEGLVSTAKLASAASRSGVSAR